MTDLLQPQLPLWTSRQVSDRLHVVVAPNPGPLTLDGTNTYVLATNAGAVVIDPGPSSDGHVARIRELSPDVAMVLLTHGHADHSDAAFALADEASCPVRAYDETWCSDGQPLIDAETIIVGDLSLQVVTTPGHTRDSVCFLVTNGGEQQLLSGDTILGRGTTFVGHPQGTLGDYLTSLRKLQSVVDHSLLILPGHGPVRDQAPDLVEAYLLHREQRLNEVRSAWVAGARDATTVATVVYGQLSEPLRAAALASTQAQLDYLGLLRDQA